jgi:rhodanese-related sulfurtransferase
MKVQFRIVLLTALVFFLWLPALALDQVPEVDSGTLNKWISEHKDLVLIDVGSRGDFADGHIAGSTSIPLTGDFIERISRLPKDKTYVVTCPTGGRSFRATRAMIDNGFDKVYNLKGGIADWIRKGFQASKGNE